MAVSASSTDQAGGRVTADAASLNDDYPFGCFNYGSKRERYYPYLPPLLGTLGPRAQVYDIGCGAGYWLDLYGRCGVGRERITCVDLSPRNVSRLLARGYDARVGNVLDLRLEDGLADCTICCGVIHHTEDPLRALRELARITKVGGCIYLVVYNGWSPYFYVVHRATYPLRYLYWNWNKRVLDAVYAPARLVFQPLARVLLGQTLDEATGRAFLADQVMNPRAHLFTKSKLRRYADLAGCSVERVHATQLGMMWEACLRREVDARPANT